MPNTKTQPKAFRVSRLGSFLFVVTLLLLLFPSWGWSAFRNVQVVCPGGASGAYPRISASLAALDPNDANTITVSGTCAENIFIEKFHNLFVESAPGQTATIAAANPSDIVLQTYQLTGVLLVGLVFQGGSTGVLLNQGSNVTNTGPGIRADFSANALVMNVTISNKSEEGVRVGRQSVSEFIPPFTIAGNSGASVSCGTTPLVFGDLSGVTKSRLLADREGAWASAIGHSE